jgi:hypothetical protein
MMPIEFTDALLRVPDKKRRAARRKGRSYPAPARSARLYILIAPSQVHMFRFLLEAQDNLGIMTVADRWRAALLLRFSPHQEKAVREFLESARQTLPFSIWRPPVGDQPDRASKRGMGANSSRAQDP